MREAIDNHHEMRRIVKALLKSQGRDLTTCESCGKKGKMTLHHSKYEGATIKDIQVLCFKCNLKEENKFLA